MDYVRKSAFRNIGLPSRIEAPPRRKSLVKEKGGRNIGLNVVNISTERANTNKPINITNYTGLSNVLYHATPTSGEVSIMPPPVVQKATATRSSSPKSQTAKQEQFIGGKRRRSARRKTRKTLRHSHRRK
jgi:hypothetical protein